MTIKFFLFIFFYQFSFTDTDDSHDSRGREGRGGDHLFILLCHYHLLTNIQIFILQLCKWDDYHIFLIAPLVFTRLLKISIITMWLIDDVKLIFVYLLFDLIQGFCYSYLKLETSGLELASTIILALKANQLTKCASHLINKAWK